MRINDWLALEEKYKFKFPGDFFSLYQELERTRVISDWASDGLGKLVELLQPEEIELWWEHPVNPDLLPIIITPTQGAICLRLPFRTDESAMWSSVIARPISAHRSDAPSRASSVCLPLTWTLGVLIAPKMVRWTVRTPFSNVPGGF